MRTLRRSIVRVAVCGGLVLLSGSLRLQRSTAAQPPQDSELQARVDNTIRERGTVECGRSIEVRSELKGNSTIVSIVPEGSQVKKGDLLVELDGAALRGDLGAARVQLQKAQAARTQSQMSLQAAQQAGELSLSVAKKALAVAVVSREHALGDGGQWALELTSANAQLAVARERLKICEGLITKAPGDRGGKSIGDLRLIICEARAAIQIAEAKKQFLEKHDRAYRTARFDLAVAEKQMVLARLVSEQEKAVQGAKANIIAQEAEVALVQQQLERAERQVERSRIFAPQAGIVVYAQATTGRVNRGAVLEPGATVRERQQILQIPDLSKLHVRTHVHESRIARVRIGQVARIHIDAFPDKVLHGKVTQIAKTPEPTSWLTENTKEYSVVVSLEEPTESLKIGLTALVEIDAPNSQK